MYTRFNLKGREGKKGWNHWNVMKNNTMQTPVGALGINLNASSLFSSLCFTLDWFSLSRLPDISPSYSAAEMPSKHTRMKRKKNTFLIKLTPLPPFSSHEAHIAFGFPSLLRLKPAKQKQKASKTTEKWLRRAVFTQSATRGTGVTADVNTETRGGRLTPRRSASSSSSLPSTLPLPVCDAQSHGNQQPERFAQPSIYRRTEKNGNESVSVKRLPEIIRIPLIAT